MNSTIFSNAKPCHESWWTQRVDLGNGHSRPMTRQEWDVEHAKQVEARMRLSNPPIPTAKDGPTSIQEVRRQRIPSTL